MLTRGIGLSSNLFFSWLQPYSFVRVVWLEEGSDKIGQKGIHMSGDEH